MTKPHDEFRDTKTALVLGGGLAGIAVALRLTAAGVRVTVIEARNRLGGRATSFTDPATGRTLDNCQHVLMGCCTSLVDLYRRLGVADSIKWHRTLYFMDGRGRLDQLEADDWPAPLHMTPALLKFRGLSLREKLDLTRGMLAIIRMGKAGRDAMPDITFEQWLIGQRQSRGTIDKFWSVIITSALNELPTHCSAKYAIQVFQEGFLANEQAYVMGVPAVPLVQLYDRAAQAIEANGGRVMVSTSAQRFELTDGSVSALIADGQTLSADAYVSALPFDRLARLCEAPMVDADPRLQQLQRFETSPILGIHLYYRSTNGQPVMKLPHLVLTQSPLQWVFNKGRGDESGSQHLHGVISAAHGLAAWPSQEIITLTDREMRKAFSHLPDTPPLDEIRLVDAMVVKEKRATFSLTPGIDDARPRATGAISNLYLAGDWCDTGWPATMEGAVRSGDAATMAILDDLGVTPRANRVHPGARGLEPSWLYQALAEKRT